MANKGPNKVTLRNAVRIFRVLKEVEQEDEGPLTMGEVARRCGLHPWTVSRMLDIWLKPLVEIQSVEELGAIGLQVKLVRLKEASMTEQKLPRYLKLKASL